MAKKILIFLIIIFFANIFYRVYIYRNDYLSSFDGKYWKNRYLESQWIVPNSKNPIGDDGLYAYAGYAYINGQDPTTLNGEMPPLGKYLIGLSILIFHNQNMFALICGIFVLFFFYKLNTVIFKDKLYAFIPVLLFSFEPLFYTQLRAPFLDLLQLLFLILTFLFTLKNKFLPAVIFLGLMASTKSSLTSFTLLILTIIIFLFLQKKFNEIKQFLILLPVSFAVFLITYFRYFLNGHSIIDFLKVQKWIINFYSIGAKGVIGNVFQLLFTGKWVTWFNYSAQISEWQITWPIMLLLLLVSGFILLKKIKKQNEVLFLVWSVIYLCFLAIIPLWPRYLLLVIPFMYNLSIWVLLKNIVPGLRSL